MRITLEDITHLTEPQVFIFGSNEAGIHGSGAAHIAYKKFGARLGQGFGLAGQSFGIPTKDWNVDVLPLEVIGFYIERLIEFTKRAKHLEFLVTQIGCGLARYTPEQIAPFFKECVTVKNIWLPESFLRVLGYGRDIDAERGTLLLTKAGAGGEAGL